MRERVIAEMAEIYKGTLIWGEDLMEIAIAEGWRSPSRRTEMILLAKYAGEAQTLS